MRYGCAHAQFHFLLLAKKAELARSYKMEPAVFLLVLLLVAPLGAKKQKKLEIITEV